MLRDFGAWLLLAQSCVRSSHRDPRALLVPSPCTVIPSTMILTGYAIGAEANCSTFLCCLPEVSKYVYSAPFTPSATLSRLSA
jgi:hypothetical protein